MHLSVVSSHRLNALTDQMAFCRGTKDDYDRWAEVTGDEGWSWEELAPFVRQLDRMTQPADHHNTSGEFDPAIHHRGMNDPMLFTIPMGHSSCEDRDCADQRGRVTSYHRLPSYQHDGSTFRPISLQPGLQLWKHYWSWSVRLRTCPEQWSNCTCPGWTQSTVSPNEVPSFHCETDHTRRYTRVTE